MSFHSWLRNLQSVCRLGTTARKDRRAARREPPKHLRLHLEVLEDHLTPSFSPATTLPPEFGGWAVLSADFNHDDRLDLVTNSHLLLGDGSGGFLAASSFDGGGAPVAADFDNDGHLDLAMLGRPVSVLRGNGDGTFLPPVTTAISPSAMLNSMATADFNGDGNQDLVYSAVTNSYTNSGIVEVLLGDGLGGFAVRHEYQLPTPWGLAVADVNADGRPDVVTTNYDSSRYGYDSHVSVLLGNGDGTLGYDSASSKFTTVGFPIQVEVGDFTSDGIADLVVTGATYGGSVSVQPGRGDGTFAPPIYAQSFSGQSFVVDDFNGDGRLDVFAVPTNMDLAYPPNLLLGRGDGTFEPSVPVEIGGEGTGVLGAGDFNGDGHPDLAVGIYDYSVEQVVGNAVAVVLNNGDWSPLPPRPPSLRIDDAIVTEGNMGTTAAEFTVTLSAASTETITVAYATGNGSATAGSDYQAKSGTLTFAPGQTSKTVTVLVNGDRLGEPNETFVVNLSSPTSATIADAQGVGTILDDEPRISVSDVTIAEGKKGQKTLFTFTVTLSSAYDQPVTMSFRTVNGTAKTGNGDYVAKTGTLTFAPGETTKTITIEVKGDSKREANETFFLDLFDGSSNALFTKNRGIGTIRNDD